MITSIPGNNGFLLCRPAAVPTDAARLLNCPDNRQHVYQTPLMPGSVGIAGPAVLARCLDQETSRGPRSSDL
ncbi:hypothetical protein PF002_g20689 [Phytophthora fragariae]|uniref:Uncharacterized protein n=1 Tax=Phytophthora fragariae TaxID=53985 RepID=A0A6A3XKM9_9STRA|nr:hypothetical protein PF011_g25239 [Phytophthora fragariae]KAE9204240.1 hypothetical protein PF002_g20689 [Phytophthora fragariae]